MTRTVVYGDNRLNVDDDSMSIQAIQRAICEIFPELKNAVALEKGDEIHFVVRSRMTQNMLEIELAGAKFKKEQERLEEKLRAINNEKYPRRPIHDYGWFGSDSERRRFLEHEVARTHREMHQAERIRLAKEELKRQLDKMEEAKEHFYIVGDDYAVKGGYEHLVGKKVKLIDVNEQMGVYLVKAEDDENEYVIRKQDIKQI